MNYQRIYDQLISFRQKNPVTGYTEKHHIKMSSMGGSDDPSNLVVLSGREHWIAHLLLHKIHRNQQTTFACHMMAMKCEERGIPQIKNSRMYEAIRKEVAKYTSKRMKKMLGSKNSQFGTMWICNIDLRENKKISKKDEIPEGWIKGRNCWNKKPKRIPLKAKKYQCPSCKRYFEIKYHKRKYCSKICSNQSRGVSEETKVKISESLKKYFAECEKPGISAGS